MPANRRLRVPAMPARIVQPLTVVVDFARQVVWCATFRLRQ
jgi:hypothetical protein